MQGPNPPEERGKGAAAWPGVRGQRAIDTLPDSETLCLPITIETLPLLLGVGGSEATKGHSVSAGRVLLRIEKTGLLPVQAKEMPFLKAAAFKSVK